MNLASAILKSNLSKLGKDPEKLHLYDSVIKDQLSAGIVQRIPNLEEFMEENPDASFLAHMGVFRPDKETTKCRIVYLSNLAEKNQAHGRSISHNEAMNCGPNLNRKITTALIKLRFEKNILLFDLTKAFLQIQLNEEDRKKLIFLWFRNVDQGDFAIEGMIPQRLPFGLRCSPTILMIALYKILVVDSEADDPDIRRMKRLVYDNTYMDNACVTGNSPEQLTYYHKELVKIFNSYKIPLQQWITNNSKLQAEIDQETGLSTPEEVKVFGLDYNRISDKISVPKLKLDTQADTKRKILSSIAGNWDIFGKLFYFFQDTVV